MSRIMTNGRLVNYERFMAGMPEDNRDIPEDFFCRGCRSHRPNWEYRFCKHLECPYMKGMKTFWEEVLADG